MIIVSWMLCDCPLAQAAQAGEAVASRFEDRSELRRGLCLSGGWAWSGHAPHGSGARRKISACEARAAWIREVVPGAFRVGTTYVGCYAVKDAGASTLSTRGCPATGGR
jgi:hypothetical protein